MPTQVVDIDLRTETGALPRPTFSDLIVIASEPTNGDVDYNDPQVYSTASSVSTDFGSDSDAHVASQQIEARGADHWYVVMLDIDEHTETLGDSDTESTDEGEVENTPIRGGLDNISVSVDGTDQTVVPVTESPPETPDPGEAAVNFDTGEVVVGDGTDGQGPGIEVGYETTSFDDASVNMEEEDYDLAVFADTRADRSYIGELKELLSFVEAQNASMIVAYENGNEYDTEQDAMDAAHDIGGYITSGRVFPVAHKSNDDVGAGVAGRLATKNPWFNPYMDGGADYSFSMDTYRKALIGAPDQSGTFEGGGSDGEGPTNVLYREMGTQILSNSLSTAGADSNYQFFDIARTEAFIVYEVRATLRELRLSRESIPFAPIGRTLIEAALRDRLNHYVSPSGRALSPAEVQQMDEEAEQDLVYLDDPRRATDRNVDVPLSELEIHVPPYDELSQSDRANREWTGIRIDATLAGNVHTFSVELAVLV